MTTLKPPTLPMYPTPRDWEWLNNELRHQVMLISEHMERFAELVSDNACSNSGQVPSRHVRELVREALEGAVEDIEAAITLNHQAAKEAA
jgi:hypothetical protein